MRVRERVKSLEGKKEEKKKVAWLVWPSSGFWDARLSLEGKIRSYYTLIVVPWRLGFMRQVRGRPYNCVPLDSQIHAAYFNFNRSRLRFLLKKQGNN